MDNISGYTLVLIIVGVILITATLVAVFYKPGKKIIVSCNFKNNADGKPPTIIEVNIENTGKKQLKMMAPFVDFTTLQHSMIFQIKSEMAHCNFPHLLRVGEKLSCEVDLTHYHNSLQESDFHPSHIKVFVKDTVGMQFNSNHLDYKIH